MKSFQHTKKIIFLAFLLSLLFHGGSVIIVFLEKKNNDTSTFLDEQKEEVQLNRQQQRDEWVETKARAGDFGAPVMFVDDPSYAKASEGKSSEDFEPTTEANKDKLEHKQDNTTPQEEPIEEKIEIPEEKNTIIQNPEIQFTQPKTVRPKRKPKSSPSNAHSAQSGKPPYSAEATKGKPLTLAQLTQGFLNHMKDEGTHAIHMLGKRSGRPSDEQIKYERYLQKLSWCLQNSCNIHNHNFPASARGDDKLHVLLALNKDGSLKQCLISKTSGNRELDNFTLFLFKDASTSFPPVPQYLPHDPFTITYVIMVGNTEENRFRLYRQ